MIKYLIRITLKIIFMFPVVFGIITLSDYCLGYHNKLIIITFSVLMFLFLERILVRVYGFKVENFINKWL